MPKHNVIVEPGRKLDDSTEELVRRYFDSDIVDKLCRLGGRIQISIASPYRPNQQKTKTDITDDYIRNLCDGRDRPEQTEKMLRELRVSELRAVCKRLDVPVPSRLTSEELVSAILAYLGSATRFASISGAVDQPPIEESTGESGDRESEIERQNEENDAPRS